MPEFIEALELTDLARELGCRCAVSMLPDLAQKVDPRAAVSRLREVLLATAEDPKLQLFRAVVLYGTPLKQPRRAGFEDVQPAIRFLDRVRAGIGGISDGGTMLALHIGAVPMVCTVLQTSLAQTDREPRVVMTSPPEQSESLLRRLLPY